MIQVNKIRRVTHLTVLFVFDSLENFQNLKLGRTLRGKIHSLIHSFIKACIEYPVCLHSILGTGDTVVKARPRKIPSYNLHSSGGRERISK